MGFLSRRLIPREIRRAVHPVRALKRELTPRAVKSVLRAAHPIDNALYGIERKIFTKKQSGSTASQKLTYSHSGCDVAHRTPEAAQNCRRGNDFDESPSEPSVFETNCPKCGAYVNVVMDSCQNCLSVIDWEINHTSCGGKFQRTSINQSFHLKCSRCGLQL